MGTHDPRAPWFDLYVKDHCPRCEQVIRLLDQLGARYRARPLADHPEARRLAAEARTMSAQLVVAMTPVGLVADVFGGLQPLRIRRHLADYAPSVWDEQEAGA
ncbi:glutaredoxin family protein [Actinomyces ruminis]|uniref:Glutaredoxin domain-containing protein n=1 Tax=Actinomyces ruminis TaxID=1937003 RepID=A0ABX4MEY0_9ACTO|nr:glutaredoxin domain-containing protein [Actinomyces ruminis]PHP52575.1 hypothetical protein BW737_008815 [Actinomyces ruminis]